MFFLFFKRNNRSTLVVLIILSDNKAYSFDLELTINTTNKSDG